VLLALRDPPCTQHADKQPAPERRSGETRVAELDAFFATLPEPAVPICVESSDGGAGTCETAEATAVP
jgi:hypothetical protein